MRYVSNDNDAFCVIPRRAEWFAELRDLDGEPAHTVIRPPRHRPRCRGCGYLRARCDCGHARRKAA